MKRLTWIGGAAAVSLMLAGSTAMASDHGDGTVTAQNGNTDISDLYAWVDGDNTILIQNWFPGAAKASVLADNIQFVFHTASLAAYGSTTTVPLDIICTFDANQNISVWVGAVDYVTGNASATRAGITSASGNTQVYAGVVADPFFFNEGGLGNAIAAADAVIASDPASLMLNGAGCPTAVASTLAPYLTHTANGTMPAVNSFAPSATYSGDVQTIVLSIKTSLLTTGGPILSVWASTNQGT